MNEQDKTYEQTIAEMQSVINSVVKARDEFYYRCEDLQGRCDKLLEENQALNTRCCNLADINNKLKAEERECSLSETDPTIPMTDHENAIKGKDAVIETLMQELVWHRSAVDDDLKACIQQLNLVQAEYDGFKEAVKIMAGNE